MSKIELFDEAEVVAHAEVLFPEGEYGHAWNHRLVTYYKNASQRQAQRDQKIVDELLGVIEQLRSVVEKVATTVVRAECEECSDPINVRFSVKPVLETLAAIDAKLQGLGVKNG